MKKHEAHAYLNRIRDGQMPLADATAALIATGDIVGLFGKPLRTNGNESSIDRSCKTHDQRIETGFSYSGYLDCKTN
jgi:hypothetical protein